jgi:hypothetical protein
VRRDVKPAFDHYDWGTLQIETQLPKASKTAMSRMPAVRCRAIDRENRVVAIGASVWRHAGWQYSTVGSLISEIAYPLELEAPGFAKIAIPAFRDMLTNATPVPAGTRVIVTRNPTGDDPDGAKKYPIRTADRLASKLAIVAEREPASAEFSFAFADLLNREETDQLLYALGNLSDDQMRWDVSIAREGTAATPESVTAESQLSLGLS